MAATPTRDSLFRKRAHSIQCPQAPLNQRSVRGPCRVINPSFLPSRLSLPSPRSSFARGTRNKIVRVQPRRQSRPASAISPRYCHDRQPGAPPLASFCPPPFWSPGAVGIYVRSFATSNFSQTLRPHCSPHFLILFPALTTIIIYISSHDSNGSGNGINGMLNSSNVLPLPNIASQQHKHRWTRHSYR